MVTAGAAASGAEVRVSASMSARVPSRRLTYGCLLRDVILWHGWRIAWALMRSGRQAIGKGSKEANEEAVCTFLLWFDEQDKYSTRLSRDLCLYISRQEKLSLQLQSLA